MAKLIPIYRIDKKGNPVPGSNIKIYRRNFGGKGLAHIKIAGERWLPLELFTSCCPPDLPDLPCQCNEFKYFVQVDGRHQPVDHTLIRRAKRPEGTSGFRFVEIPSNLCC